MIPSPTELKAALESMSRVRAVELPPDSAGGRTLFHRGQHGADLASRVDSTGKAVRHELFYFGQYLCWTANAGVRTGEVGTNAIEEVVKRGDGPAQGVLFHNDPQLSAKKLAEVAEAIGDCAHSDPVVQHLQHVLVLAAEGKAADSSMQVTRTENAVNLEVLRREAEESQKRELHRRKKAQNAVLLIFGLTLLLAFGSIAAWIITR